MGIVAKKRGIGLVIFAICCIGCGKQIDRIPDVISNILQHNGIYSAQIDKLADYSQYTLNYNSLHSENIEISDNDVKNYVEIQMESYAQLVEVLDRKEARDGDVVVVSYEVILDKKVVNRVTQDKLMIGSGNYNHQFEEALIGQHVGEPFTKEMVSPNGEKMIFQITIESINYFKTYELTDKFVQENMGFSSVEAYYESCKKVLLNEKIQEEKERRRIKLWEDITNECEFSLNVEEIAQYSLQYVEMQKQIADVYGMSLDTYVQEELKKSKEDFYHDCYAKGEREVKKMLLIGAIFSDLQYSIEDKDIEQMCEKFEYTYEEILNDECVFLLVKYAIMEEKIIEYFEK